MSESFGSFTITTQKWHPEFYESDDEDDDDIKNVARPPTPPHKHDVIGETKFIEEDEKLLAEYQEEYYGIGKKKKIHEDSKKFSMELWNHINPGYIQDEFQKTEAQMVFADHSEFAPQVDKTHFHSRDKFSEYAESKIRHDLVMNPGGRK